MAKDEPGWIGAVKVVSTAVIVVCALVYVWGCLEFRSTYDGLLEAGFNNVNASKDVGAHIIVDSRFRDIAWLNAAAFASAVGAIAVFVRLTFRGSPGLYLPGRSAAQALLFVSYILLFNDALINADLVSLDHNAVGILRYDEDSWGPLILIVLASPLVMILLVLGFWTGAQDLRFRPASLKYVNPGLICVGVLLLLVLLALVFPSVYYDTTSAHSLLGVGSYLLCAYSLAAMVAGRAQRIAEKRDAKRPR